MKPTLATSSNRQIAFLRKLCWILLRIYLLVALLVYLMQGKMLYLKTPETPEQTLSQAQFDGLKFWPQPAHYQALLYQDPAAGNAIVGTVVLFHGNAGVAGDRSFYAKQLARCGLRSLLVEYPGYGARPDGELSERALSHEAEAIILNAKAQFGAPLYVIGESLGAAVAAQAIALAERQVGNAVQAALMITPWDELRSPAAARFGFLPLRLILKDRYDSVAALQHFQQPLIVVRAQSDQLIPAASTLRLFEAYAGPKTLLELPGDHNSWWESADDAWWQMVCSKLTKH